MAKALASASTRATRAAVERETQLVREAIAFVAAGGSRRVIVAGIRYGDTVLDVARQMAIEAGVRVNPIRKASHDGADIVVEPIFE